MLFARMAAIASLWLVAGPHFAAAQVPTAQVPAAQAPASGGPVDAALIADLVAAHRILADQGWSMPMAMSASAIRPIRTAI